MCMVPISTSSDNFLLRKYRNTFVLAPLCAYIKYYITKDYSPRWIINIGQLGTVISHYEWKNRN